MVFIAFLILARGSLAVSLALIAAALVILSALAYSQNDEHTFTSIDRPAYQAS